MRIVLASCIALTFLLAVTLETAAEDPATSDGVDWTARAQATWHKTCQKCHAVPDVRYETDRAFLRQITETT